MKNIFKKIAVIAMAILMCTSSVVPTFAVGTAKCPGAGNMHASPNCDYTIIAQSEPTCEEKGFITGRCNGCSTTFVVDSTPNLGGHDWDETKILCTADSYKICKRCGAREDLPGLSTGHTWGDWISTGNACFEGNTRSRACLVCGTSQSDVMDEEHAWAIGAYTEPESCLNPAKATYVCENLGCDASKAVELWLKSEENPSHRYRKWDTPASDPDYDAVLKLTNGAPDPNNPASLPHTCTRDGVETEICIDCGMTRAVYTPAWKYVHTLDDMKFVDGVDNVKGCAGSAKYAYWECYECGIKFQQKEKISSSTAGEWYYAKMGGYSPAYTAAELTALGYATNYHGSAPSGYWIVYYDYTYKDVDHYKNLEASTGAAIAFVEGDEFKEITSPDGIWAFGHGTGNVDTLYPTCEKDGYEDVHCKKCGTVKYTAKPALGHKYYADVASKDRSSILSKLGILHSSKDLSSDTWDTYGNVGLAIGENNNVWDLVYLATCTQYASVVWCCLNIDQNQMLPVGYIYCGDSKKLTDQNDKIITSAEYKALPSDSTDTTVITKKDYQYDTGEKDKNGLPIMAQAKGHIRILEGEELFADFRNGWTGSGNHAAYVQCTEVKEVLLSGDRDKPFGHRLGDTPSSITRVVGCENIGIYAYDCENEFHYYEFDSSMNKIIKKVSELPAGKNADGKHETACDSGESVTVPALGHKWVEDKTDPNYKPVTCEEDGVIVYKCDRAGCTETKEEKVDSTGEEHVWDQVDRYVSKNQEPTCFDDVVKYATCSVCDMIDYKLITEPALGHDYFELDAEAMAKLTTTKVGVKGNLLYVDANGMLHNEAGTGRELVAQYVLEGGCTESAAYKLFCRRQGCNVTGVFEPNKDNLKGKHDMVIVPFYYSQYGVYSPDAGSVSDNDDMTIAAPKCTESTITYRWYCKDKTCSAYRTEDFSKITAGVQKYKDKKLITGSIWVDKHGNLTGTLNSDGTREHMFEEIIVYGTHFNPETGFAITYKDVPDERISGAATLIEARTVAAPVDENGNTIYAVEIPGTTLVWRYITNVSCDNDQVAYGGFFCVKCEGYKGDTAAVVGTKRAEHHTVTVNNTVKADCVYYGFADYTCDNCDYTVQREYQAQKDTHDIDPRKPISVTENACEAIGAQVFRCRHEDCRQLVTIVIPATGHVNVNGVKLINSCVDKNALVDNRKCKYCNQIIFAEHHFEYGKCKDCGLEVKK